jgi:uncharacterized protein (TIGR02246 family)
MPTFTKGSTSRTRALWPEGTGRWRSGSNVSKIRLLTPGVAVVHVRSELLLKSDPDKKTKNIITALMHKREGEWEIVAFHNAPAQEQDE